MGITVHLARSLSESVDQRARELGISRNRYIVRALEQALAMERRWSPRFVETLRAAQQDVESRKAGEELRAAIAAGRAPGG